MRTFDARLVSEAVSFFRKTELDFDPIDWVSNPANIALGNGQDMALFEHETPRVVTGHYFFQSRGRQALEQGRLFLDEVFSPCYNVEVIRGLTPLQHLGARWMNRQLGFTSHGVVQSTIGPHELVILTRKEYFE